MNAIPALHYPEATTEQHLLLTDVSWAAYEQIGAALRDRGGIRLTYDRGNLEIMTTSHEHERYKKRLGRVVETLAEEFALPLETAGNMTFKGELAERGFETDDCFWIANAAAMRTVTSWEPTRDPPPDLVTEIEISRSLTNRLELLAKLRVPEVWRFDGEHLRALCLQADGTYQEVASSPTFPGIPLAGIVPFLLPDENRDHLAAIRAFRAWVREQRGNNP